MQKVTVKSKTINISKCFGDIIDHESEACMVCDITRNPRSIYSCLHTWLYFYCIEYIDPNINKNDRKLWEHEIRNILFCFCLLSASVSHAFHFFSQLSVCPPLPCPPFFIPRFICIFRSFEFLSNISYFEVWDTSNATGNLFALKTSQ